MKKLSIIILGFALLGGSYVGFSQEETAEEGISKKLGYYIMPNDGQDAETMKKDEEACFKWALEQSGYDPDNPPVIVADTVASTRGAGVKGAAKGAAVGAAVGSISGDAGDGAAYGAIAGGVRSRRGAKKQAQQQQAANNQAADAQEKALLDDYKKAYSLCLESKGYSLK